MLQLKNIVYTVPTEDGGRRRVLDDVSLDFAEGEQTIITGHNGSGKTTLAKVIMGIITPDSGKVILDGEDISGLSVDERARRGIAFAFQQPVRFKGLKVKDLLEVALGGKPAGRSELCACLANVGLCAADYLDRELSGSLSGGELKRIEIAMALLRDCKVSVFDEPEAGIDIWSFDKLVGAFRALRGENKVTVLVSHQEKIMREADRLILLSNGKVERIGAPSEVLMYIHSDRPCRRLTGEDNDGRA